MTLLEVYNMKHNFDIICVSETYLDSSIQHDDNGLHLNGHKLARADSFKNNKRGEVGIYVKEFLVTRQMELNDFSECIVFEVAIQNKKSYIISLYRSPSQSCGEFDNFLLKFEQFLCDIMSRNQFVVLIAGDFNARTAKWWGNDTIITKGTKIDLITISCDFSQIVSDPNSYFSIFFFLH